MREIFRKITVLLLCLTMVLTSQSGIFAYAAEETATQGSNETAEMVDSEPAEPEEAEPEEAEPEEAKPKEAEPEESGVKVSIAPVDDKPYDIIELAVRSADDPSAYIWGSGITTDRKLLKKIGDPEDLLDTLGKISEEKDADSQITDLAADWAEKGYFIWDNVLEPEDKGSDEYFLPEGLYLISDEDGFYVPEFVEVEDEALRIKLRKHEAKEEKPAEAEIDDNKLPESADASAEEASPSKDNVSEDQAQDENSEKEASNEPAGKDAADKQQTPEKASEEKSKDTTAKKNTAQKETVETTESGTHTSTDQVDAVTLHDEAAENKRDAAKALRKEMSFSRRDARAIANDLFEAELGVKSEDVPRQGDGSNIESITAKWTTPDTVDNDDAGFLYYKPADDSPFDIRLQVNYALSGEHNYEPGDITITIPENIIKDRSGKLAGEVVLPFPEDPSTKADFNWKLVDGNYVLTNTKRMSAATKGYFQVGFTGLVPHSLVDMEVSEDFDAYIEVTTHKGNTIALRSNKLSAQFDTEARIVNGSVSKRQYGSAERVPASDIPEEQRIPGEEEYIVVKWYAWASISANTYYTLDIKDTLPQDKQVTESGLTEADMHGFLLHATSEDGHTIVKDNIYRGYRSGTTNYYYFETAYPASQFEPDTKYSFHNAVEMKVTEVDPPAEVTNANVQTEDPQLVTDGESLADTEYRYRLPQWSSPTGHFMVCKNGNDDKAGGNKTHLSRSSKSDIHIWKNLDPDDTWYGIYPSSMNKLQDGDDVYLSYTIDSIGYAMPWMFDEASYDTDGDKAPRKSVNYTRPVTMVTEDTGVRYKKDKLAVFEDYEFVSLEFPQMPHVYTGEPKNINPDGSWTTLTAGDGTFEYVQDPDYSHYPDITLELYRGGEWSEYATVSWQTGTAKITLKNGTEISGSVVDVPSDTENFRTKVTVQNTLGTNIKNVISQAAIDYDVRPVVKLINTDAVKAIVEEKFNGSHNPSMKVYNSVNMKAYDAEDEEIISIDKEGYDVLYGYTTEIAVYPKKTATQTIKDADYVNRQVTVHYSAQVEERSVINDKETYQQAVEDGRLASETHGYWYDLLPKGMTPDISTIKLREKDKIVDVRTIENYKNSGRTLLIVETELTPVLKRYSSGDMYYYEDVPTISFNAKYDFDALTDYGKVVHNVIAFESSNDHIGTANGYSGEPDDPNTENNNNVSTPNAFKSNNEKVWMTDLDADRDDPSFVYAGASTTIDIISAARLSLQKDVMVNDDGRWDTGVFGSDPVSGDDGTSYTYNEHSKEDNEMLVWEGGRYSYKLRMMPDTGTRARDMVIYDSLENFMAGDGNEPIDEMAAAAGATWHGEFLGVDVSQLREKDCAPVIYYSTIPNLELSDETDPHIGNEENMLFKEDGTVNSAIWIESSAYTGDLSAVKAVAIDATKKTDGSDFTLEPLESALVLINMRAPEGEDARQIIAKAGAWGTSAYAYNNAYLTGTTIDVETHGEDSDNFVRKDYTKVGLKEFKYNVKKIWADGDNRDGKRPESVTVHLYANGADTGKTLTLKEDNNWEGSFEDIPYTTPDGTKIHYSVREDDVEFYTKSISANETGGKITNTHDPEKISLDVSKNWEGDTEDSRPEYIDVELYANGVKTQTKRIDKSTDWKCTFEDLYKNENGEPIIYTAKEVFPNGDEKHLSYIAGEPDGITLTSAPEDPSFLGNLFGNNEDAETQDTFTNTYNSYGDLYVTKAVTDATVISKEQLFEFTFKFSRMEDEEEIPVFDEFDYDILDEADEVVSSGKISSNNTVSIKGGQRIHVKHIDEYVNYSVTENENSGFVQKEAVNDNGIIVPNADNTASFTNQYSASGRLSLSADKTLKNRELKKYQFKFELYQLVDELDAGGNVTGTSETLIKTATSAAPDVTQTREDGTVEYSHAVATFGAIKYTQEDADVQARAGKPYRYKIVEVNLGKDGYIYDDTVYYVDVAVTDNGDGTLGIVPTYYKEIPDGGNTIIDDILNNDVPSYEEVEKAEFINEYKANGEIDIRAWKDLQGRKLTAGEFEFELLDENGQPVHKVNPETGEPTDELITAANTEDGSVVFEALKFDEKDIGKTINYAIREKKGTDGTVNYDENTYGYSITVYDNGDGTLSFSQVPATPIMATRQCEACEGNGYMIDDEHPYVMYGPFEGIYSPTDNRWVKVFVPSGMAGAYINWRKYNYRSLNCADDYFESGSNSYNDTANNDTLANIAANMIAGDVSDVTSNNICLYEPIDATPISVTDGTDPNIGSVVENKTISYNGAFYDLIKSGVSSSYSGMWLLNYYLAQYSECEVCNGTGQETIITGWETEESDLPVFRNTLKDGKLSISKQVTNAENADPNQKFKFKVKLIGDGIEDKEFDYDLSQRAKDSDTSDSGKNASPGIKTQTSDKNPEHNTSADEKNNKEDKKSSENTKDTNADKNESEKSLSSRILERIIPSAYAAATAGTSGTCKWEINSAGVLRIYPSNGVSGQLASYTGAHAPWYASRASVKKVVVANGVRTNEGCNQLLAGLKNCTEMDLRGLDTSSATNMKYMFSGCSTLATLSLSGFDTTNVTDMSYMFSNCAKLTSLDLSSLNTGNVTDMTNMFSRCLALENINMSGFVTDNVSKMSYMFTFCQKLKSIDLSNFNTGNVTDMKGMFNECNSLKSIDVSNFDTSNVTDMSDMFSACSSITSLDFSNFNTSKVTTMSNMFNGCSKLKSLDLSSFDTKKLRGMTYMFRYCTDLAYLDLSSFDTSGMSGMNSPFEGTTNLSCIVLGEDFVFKTWITCTEPNDEYTGKWIREDELFGPYTADELVQNYDGSTMAGVWVWEKRSTTYTLNFATEEGATGSMPPVKPAAAEEYKLPENQFIKFGYEFDHWDDGNGHSYANKETIPASTYSAGDRITLTAIFTPRNTTVNMENGEFEFELYGDETATFNDIPAGTAYQVYEETPDGWVLIEQSNTSGTIEPLETAEASFTNKYEPGTATAQFFGTKTLDGQAAEAESYSFSLRETTDGASGTVKMLVDGEEQDVTLPYTVTVSDGGFIQFPAIKYFVEDIGSHTYEIAEVNPNSSRIDYDTHKELVTVNVTGDITELNAETTVDAEGDGKIAFANRTRPGTLQIKKNGSRITPANKDDEFTFKVTLKSNKGLPLSDDEKIYWYKTDEHGNLVQEAPEEPIDVNDENQIDTKESKRPAPLMSNNHSSKKSSGTSWNIRSSEGINDDEVAIPKRLSKNSTKTPLKAGDNTEGEAYAVLTAEGELILCRSTNSYSNNTSGTLTDINGSEYTGTIYSGIETINNTGTSNCAWYSKKSSIKSVKIADNTKISPINCSNWFNSCTNMTSCNLTGLDTSNVTNMASMFSGCKNLTVLDLSGFDTSKVTNMYHLFIGCTGLTSLNVSSFDTSNVTSMNSMFYNCQSLISLDLSSFDTSKITTMKEMFFYCSSLKSLDVSNFDTSNVDDMEGMFHNCSSLENLNISGFNTSKVVTMCQMFANCPKLTSLDVSGFDTSKVTSMREMFYYCPKLSSLDVSGFDTSKVTSMREMFSGCKNLTSLDVSNFDTSRVRDMKAMFGHNNLTSLDLSNFNTNNVTDMNGMFVDCSQLQSVVLGENFSFTGNNITSTYGKSFLPNPPSSAPYISKWVCEEKACGPYTADELTDLYDGSSMSGVWTWATDPTVGVVLFDANGGTINGSNRMEVTPNDPSVTLLNADKVERPHFILTGWNTTADSTGDHYGLESTFTVPLGKITTLYAEWEDTNKRNYIVRHYQQKVNLSGYTLTDTEVEEADVGSPITPKVKNYPGFVAPPTQTFVLSADDDNTVIEYRYDRVVYNIAYDGNGATSGQMPSKQVVYGASSYLDKNTYQKSGAIFTGWNTEADGSGTYYADGLRVINLTSENGKTVTLYAQWMDNTNEALTPANGEIYVKCKAGETIVIPDLPEGTTYTVEEVGMGDGWTQTGIVNENGTITANETSMATVTNRYEATGELELRAHKSMEGYDLKGGEFTFALSMYDYDSGYIPIGTATNGETDKNETISGEDGDVPNEWYNTAPVVFDKLTFFTQYDVGQTYLFMISEQEGEDSSIEYDLTPRYVRVTVRDAGKGMLDFDVEYDDGKEPLFTNEKKAGALEITKQIQGPAENASNDLFDFDIELLDREGNPLQGTYTARHYDGNTHQITQVVHSENVDDNGNKIRDYTTERYDDEYGTPKPYFASTRIPMQGNVHVDVRYLTYSYFSIVNGVYPEGNIPYDVEYVNVPSLNGPPEELQTTSCEFETSDGVTFVFAHNPINPESSYYNEIVNYGFYAVVTGESDCNMLEVANNDTLHLKGGEKIVIEGLPDGATYKITEKPKANWSLVSVQDSEGDIAAGATSRAIFTNAYKEVPYKANGQVQLSAKKTVAGGTIKSKGDYLFELLDENGEIIQSKNVDTEGGSSSTITFDPIAYTKEAAAVPIEYEVQATLMKGGASQPEVITLNDSDYTVSSNGQSFDISGTFNWDTEACAGCNRSQVIISVVPKDDRFIEYTRQEVFDMSDKDSVDFTFDKLKAFDGGQHIYTIREKHGFDDYTSYDATTYEAVVTVTDSGEGYLQTSTEYRKNNNVIPEAEFINTKHADISIVKKDAKTLVTLPNATFTIKANDKYLHSDGTLSVEPEEFTTDNRGRINIEKVTAGTYTLHETEAPEGYIKANDIVFTVDENGAVVNNESVDEIVVLEERKTQSLTIGKTVGGSTGDMNEGFEFEVRFYNLTNIQTQFHALAYHFPSGNGTSSYGGISINSIIPGYSSMSASEQKSAIAGLPLKANGEEKTITAQNTHTQVTAKETTLSGTYRYDGHDFNYRIFVYNDSANNVCGVCEERVFGTETLTDITDIPSGVTRVAKGRYKFLLKHNGTITFENLPYDIQYVVTEKRADQDGYVTSASAQVGNVAANKNVSGSLTDNESISYTNTRDGVVPTGKAKTSSVMFIMLAVAGLLIAGKKKRRKAEN